MIGLVAWVLAAGAEPSAAAVSPDDIVVVAQRLHRVRWVFHADEHGRLRDCKVTRSSGNAMIDATVCEATRQCAAQRLGSETAIAACAAPLARQLVLAARTAVQR